MHTLRNCMYYHVTLFLLEIASDSQKDIEPHILQRLSFSVTPACKSL